MLILLGTNHNSAPLAFRERVAFSSDLREPLAALLSRDRIEEGIILSTCNRVEILARSSAGPEHGLAQLREFLEEQRQVAAKDLARYSYHFHDREAIRHLLRVATGLDSMILGEPQILGQVRLAYRVAQAQGATGPLLGRLMQHCLGAAKRLRVSTGISRHAVSVAKAAVGLATRVFGRLERRKALLLGAGKMGDLVARYLRSSGVEDLAVASRTYNHAVESAKRFGGRAIHWDEGLSHLTEVDIVISCTASPRVVIHKEQVARALRARRREPLFLIDIAVPRDIEPAVNELDNVYLFDIDALHSVVDANMQARLRAAERATRMIEGEVEAFQRWQRSQEVVPIITALRDRLHTMSRQEIDRARRKLGPLTPSQERGLEELVRAVIHKVLHRPIRRLNQAAGRHDVDQLVTLYREIFGLGEPGSESTSRAGDEPSKDGKGGKRGPERLNRGGNS